MWHGLSLFINAGRLLKKSTLRMNEEKRIK